jgi:hypothetical protein
MVSGEDPGGGGDGDGDGEAACNEMQARQFLTQASCLTQMRGMPGMGGWTDIWPESAAL